MAQPELPVAVERADGQRDGFRGHPARLAADRCRGARSVHVPGWLADLGGYRRVRAHRPAGRSPGGPAGQAAADDLVRRGANADHRLGAAGGRVRCSHLETAVRGRDYRRRVHRLLRRGLSELPARGGGPGAAGGRQRQAGRDPVLRSGGGAGPGWRPGGPGRRGRCHGGGRDLLRRLGGVPAGHQHPRGSPAGSRRPPGTESRDRRRTGVRAAASRSARCSAAPSAPSWGYAPHCGSPSPAAGRPAGGCSSPRSAGCVPWQTSRA